MAASKAISDLILTSSAIGSSTVIVTRAYIFKPVRWWLLMKANKLGRLVNCPLCFSTWTSLIGAKLIYRDMPVMGSSLTTFLITWLALTTFATPWAVMIFHLYSTMPSKERQLYERMEEVENEVN